MPNADDASGSATADWYRRAATRDLVGHSPLHAAWAAGIAADEEVLARLETLPREHRQPSLVFSVATWLGASATPYAPFREFLLAHWAAFAAAAATRRTQTNEVGRCAPLVAALERIPGPIALLEVGASAGLCLLPDRYGYRFRDGVLLGSGSPVLDCDVDGPAPTTLPDIRWRLGIDLHPLDVRDAEDRRWLESLIPLDRPDRRARLAAALDTARVDPPRVIAGDALDDLPRAAAAAPPGLTLVVASLGTLVYLPPRARAAFPDAVAALGARLVTLEQSGLADPGVAVGSGRFVLALDREVLAEVSPHGDRMRFLGPGSTAAGHRADGPASA